MTEHNTKYQRFFDDAVHWLDDFKNHEVTSMVKFMDTAKAYFNAAEDLTQEEISLFTQGVKRDLNEFYLRYQDESKQSVWLGSINESFWHSLTQLTDKSQVEWSELTADFEHNGIYNCGELVGIGVLKCTKCEQTLEILHPGKLSTCLGCGHHQFTRYSLDP